MPVATSTKFQTKIEIPYGELKSIINWCIDNCKYDWTFEVIDNAGLTSGSYTFKFESEKDFITFLLWKK